MAEEADVVVIGAGAVGLACARELALRGRSVLVLEQHGLIGSETSARNSEVIHAGIYYPTGSLKARLCVAGKHLLYRYCAHAGVPHRRCGKMIVATEPAHLDILRGYQAQAERNGAGTLEWLDEAEVRHREPAVNAIAGVFSPTTGIIDSHSYMLALQGDVEANGGLVVLNTVARELVLGDHGIHIVTDELELVAQCVVNSAGHGAPDLARGVLPDTPPAYFARGRYYGYSGAPPFSGLVYPVAEAGGLGVHVTVDLAGQVRFGPDVEWIDGLDYAFDDGRREAFRAAIARYFPDVDGERLLPGYTGIRPKISGPTEAAADFVIAGPADHGIPGLVNLLGIESPGLTSSLAIAEVVANALAPG